MPNPAPMPISALFSELFRRYNPIYLNINAFRCKNGTRLCMQFKAFGRTLKTMVLVTITYSFNSTATMISVLQALSQGLEALRGL